jgi:tape measure domain-containing protein
MTVVRELVTLLRYQVDDSGLKAYQQAFEHMLAAMVNASAQASVAIRRAFSSAFAGMQNTQQAGYAMPQSPRQGLSAAQQHATASGGLRGVVQLTLGDAPLKRILSDIDAWAQTQWRLRQAAGGEAQYAEADREVARVSRTTRTPYAENVGTYTRTRQVLEDQGRAGQDAAGLTESLALSMALSGTPAQDRGGAVAALLKMIEQGRLGLDEYNTLPRRMQDALAAGLDVNRSQLREQVQGGQVTADRALPALQSQLPRMRAEIEAAPASITGAMTVFNDALQRYFGETLPGGRSALQAVTVSIQYLADNISTVVKLLALAGASLGLVSLGAWLRRATVLSGGLAQSLLAATRVALGLDAAMSMRRGPAGAMQMLSVWTRSVAPMLRMAAVLATIYLIGEDIANWLGGADSVLGGWIGGVEQWQVELDAVLAAVAYVKDLLGGAAQALGPWIQQFAAIAVLAFGLWRILSPVGSVILFLAKTAVPMLWNAFMYLATTVVPMLWSGLMYVAQTVIPMLWNGLMFLARTVIPYLWNAFAMTPIGRIISAVSLLALALWQIWDNWDVIKAYIAASWGELMAMANDSFLGPVMTYIAAIWNFWVDLVKGVIAAFTGDWDGAISHWLGAFNGLWTFFSGMGERMIATIKEIGGAIETWVLDKLKAAKTWFKDLLPDWMKSDDQASVMDGRGAQPDMPPAWLGVASGVQIQSIPPASVVGPGPSAGRGALMYQNSNDIVVNVAHADPLVVREAVTRGVDIGTQRSINTWAQTFDLTPTVEARG